MMLPSSPPLSGLLSTSFVILNEACEHAVKNPRGCRVTTTVGVAMDFHVPSASQNPPSAAEQIPHRRCAKNALRRFGMTIGVVRGKSVKSVDYLTHKERADTSTKIALPPFSLS